MSGLSPLSAKEADYLQTETPVTFLGGSSRFCYYAGRYYFIVVDYHCDIIPMGRDTTVGHMITRFTEFFSWTTIPDILWSDKGLQFTVTDFKSFVHQCGFLQLLVKSRSCYQGYEKFTRIGCAAGVSIKRNYVEPFCSTEILHPEKMVYFTTALLPQNGSVVDRRASDHKPHQRQAEDTTMQQHNLSQR